MRDALIDVLMCPGCGGHDLFLNSEELFDDREIRTGKITCSKCNSTYPIVEGVPVFINIDNVDDVIRETSEHYGEGWVRGAMNSEMTLEEKWHFDEMVRVHEFPVGQRGWGIEGGCGHGKDTVRLSLANPDAQIVSVDLSDGVYVAQSRMKSLGIQNVHIIRADLAAIPIRDNVIDFGYSFGVLHHMPVPGKGMEQIARVLKPKARLVTYLYTDLKEEPLVRLLLMPVSILRKITQRLPLWALRVFCVCLTPFIFLGLTLPARLLKFVGARSLAQRIPYHHDKTMGNIYGELYDRFGARVEYRYNPDSLHDLYQHSGMSMEGVGRIEKWRGWVSWAHKIGPSGR